MRIADKLTEKQHYSINDISSYFNSDSKNNKTKLIIQIFNFIKSILFNINNLIPVFPPYSYILLIYKSIFLNFFKLYKKNELIYKFI